MSDVIQTIVQTAIVSAIFIYIGKTMLDKLIKRSEEFEKLKEKQIEINVGRVEKANDRVSHEIKDLQKTVDELKLSVIKIQHKIETAQEKTEATNQELQRFVSYADKVIKDVERSQIIELSKRLQLLLIKNKQQP